MAFGQPQKPKSNTKFPKGVFVNAYKVVSIKDHPSKFDQDISLLVEGTTEGAEWNKKLFLGGNHKKDANGMPEEYGSSKNNTKFGSWRVGHFLEKLGLDPMMALESDGSTLTDVAKADALDRSLFILEYESNGPRTRQIWKFFASSEEGKDNLLNRWSNQKSTMVPADYKHKDGDQRLEAMFDEKDDSAPWNN
tara:strand:+ start:950 stop:1528 length:579 start_codon:yes stop_codon:yes gene_type:complete